MEYINNTRKIRIVKIKNNLLELEKSFEELKDKELRDREVKFRKKIEDLFFKPINTSMNDLNKFEEKEMAKKKPLAKSTWYK